MTKFGDITKRVSLSKGAIKIQTFKPLTLDAQNFQDWQVPTKDKTGQNLGVPKWKDPSQTKTLKFNLKHLR